MQLFKKFFGASPESSGGGEYNPYTEFIDCIRGVHDDHTYTFAVGVHPQDHVRPNSEGWPEEVSFAVFGWENGTYYVSVRPSKVDVLVNGLKIVQKKPLYPYDTVSFNHDVHTFAVTIPEI